MKERTKDLLGKIGFYAFLFVPLGTWVTACKLLTNHRNHKTVTYDSVEVVVECNTCPETMVITWREYVQRFPRTQGKEKHP